MKKLQILTRLARGYLLFLTLFLLSCDFTPLLHKRILQAQKFIYSHEYKKAIITYEEILKSHPDNLTRTKIYYQLGDIYSIYMVDNVKALNYYQKVKGVKGSAGPFWQVRAEERIADINFSYLKNYQEAAKGYKNLTQFIPRLENMDLYQYKLGLCYQYLELWKKSENIFQKILSNSQHSYYVKAINQLGMLYFLQKKWNKALYYWSIYIKKETRRDLVIDTKFMMANIYETKEELKEAYDMYYTILSEYPNTEVIKNRMNSIYKRRIARKR